MNILKDFCTIRRQLFRQENIFGYKTALVNQLYGFYCILSIERYFTDQFHSSTKIFFLIWHFFGLVTPVLIIFEYVLYLEKGDLILFQHILFLIMAFTFMRIGVPLLFLKYADDFKRMMVEIDSKIGNIGELFSNLNKAIDLKSMAINNMLFFCSFQAAFALITTLDVLVFYDENKLKNYSYYIFPLPKLDQYGNLWIFLSANGCGILATIAFSLELCVLFGIPLILVVLCHNEVLVICHTLKQHSMRFYSRVEKESKEVGIASVLQNDDIRSLRNALVISVLRYQRVIKIIKYFKGFQVTLSLITLFTIFMFSVSHIYAILTMNGAYVLRLKEIFISISTAHVMYYFCNVGDILNGLTEIMSFEVYSMPWYCSTAIRKDVCLFLCQSQHEMTLKAAKVYPILLSSFLRLISSVYSTVNVLRKVTT